MPDERSREALLQWAIVLIAIVVVVVTHASHGLPFNLDDQGQYLSHAKALLEGRPYGDIGFIYTNYNNFIGPVVEPPGIPVLIAPALAISGPDLAPVRAVMFGSLLVFVWLVWQLVEPLAGRWMAVGVTVTSLAVFSFLHVPDGVFSDPPFCAAIWCVIIAANIEGPLSRRRLVTMAIAGALAFTFRMAALALLPAIVLMALTRPRREWMGLALVATVWVVAAALVMFGLPTSTALAAETARGGSRMLSDISDNIHVIRRAVVETFLYPLPSNIANDVLHGVLVLVALGGAWKLLRERPRRFAWLFTASYIFMLLILPTRATRYWWPLVPLQMLATLQGLAWLARSVRGVPRWTPALVATLFGLTGIIQGAQSPPPPFAQREDVKAVVEAIRQAIRPKEVPRVAIFSPRLLTWYTGYPAMGHFSATPDQVLAELRDKKIDFLVAGTLGEQVIPDSSIDRALAERSEGFAPLGTFGGLALYRVLP